jgi:hypothetical protein
MGVMMLPKSSFVFCVDFITQKKTSSGARPALPMGVAPEAIVKKSYFEYRLKDIMATFIPSNRSFAVIISLGARFRAPNDSSPRGYSRILSGIDSKN